MDENKRTLMICSETGETILNYLPYDTDDGFELEWFVVKPKVSHDEKGYVAGIFQSEEDARKFAGSGLASQNGAYVMCEPFACAFLDAYNTFMSGMFDPYVWNSTSGKEMVLSHFSKTPLPELHKFSKSCTNYLLLKAVKSGDVDGKTAFNLLESEAMYCGYSKNGILLEYNASTDDYRLVLFLRPERLPGLNKDLKPFPIPLRGQDIADLIGSSDIGLPVSGCVIEPLSSVRICFDFAEEMVDCAEEEIL